LQRYGHFSIFQDDDSRHRRFFEILHFNGSNVELRHRIVSNFIEMSQTAAEIWRFLDFSKMAAVRHLGFVMRKFGTPQRAFGGLYYCAKFRWNRYSNFDNMHYASFFYLLRLRFENTYSRPKIGGFRGLNPTNAQQPHRDPLKARLVRKHVMTYRSSKSVHHCGFGAIPSMQ